MATVAKRINNSSEEIELRRGPWTLEEDTLLIHYIACHGEGRWNLLAKCAGKELLSDMDYKFITNTLILLLQFFYLCQFFYFSFFRIEEDRKELQIKMAELFKTRHQAWKPYSTRAALDP